MVRIAQIPTDSRKQGICVGLAEDAMRNLVRDMATASISTMAMRGILVSEQERIELQKAINEHVTSSIEIQAALIAIIERGDGPEAA